MKYKVGDKVLVRKDLEHDKRYSDVRFDKDMEKYKGAQATITEVDKKFKVYRIDLDKGFFSWGDDMFEGPVYVIPTPATKVMKYKVGDKVRIREDLRWSYNWNGTGINITDDMARKAGKTATIKEALQRHRYFIKEDGGSRTWHEEMFEKIVGKESDPVSHPSHYTDGKIEVIDFIQDKHLDFARGNVVKYIARAGKKDKSKELEDLKKARQYCDFAIRELEQKTEK